MKKLEVEPTLAKLSAEAVVQDNNSTDIEFLIKEAYTVALQGGRSTKNKKRNTKPEPVYQENDMRLIVAKAQEQGISAHDALKEAEFIRNPIDDFININ